MDKSFNIKKMLKRDLSTVLCSVVVLSTVFLYKCGTLDFDGGPCGIAVDSSNRVYVTFPADGIIKKYSSSGVLQFAWSAYVPSWSKGSGPYGITVWPGDLYVATTDLSNGFVIFYNASTGAKYSQYEQGGTFNNSQGIAVDSAGNLYVTDYENERVYIYMQPSGFATWNSAGSGNGEFAGPIGVAVYSTTYVYIADYRNNRIQRFTSIFTTGSYSMQWGTKGNGNGQFEGPTGVAVDSTNSWVYVADTFNNRIQKFDLNGNFLLKWGAEGSGNGEFKRPQGVAVDSSGNVYVTDTNNHRIQKFDSNGNYLIQWL